MIYSNIVDQSKVRKVQQETLHILSDALSKSFGPMGSSTAIVNILDEKKGTVGIDYTKDGYTIVKNINFLNPIEKSVQDLLVDLTQYVVREVGDGTTSAIILCSMIFDELCNSNEFANVSPADLLSSFNNVISKVNEEIESNGRECTIDDIYNIALISTNNNEYFASTIREIYKEYGMGVYIDVGISPEVDNIVKEYDGMTLDTGFTDPCFVNNKVNNTCIIKNPKIYVFNDPIDTPEMLGLLDAILDNNILKACRPGSVYEMQPTVILGKAISPDTSSYFETVVKLLNSPNGDSIPLLIISDIHQDYLLEDINKMCGCKVIKKYVDPKLQERDIENGLAPTLETVLDFCGTAEEVVSDAYKTKIIRPSKMFDENDEFSEDYNTLVKYIETQIDRAKIEDVSDSEKGRLRRRLNSLKGNMIDFLIGGITVSDRNNMKASIEDAVLNCRSAAKNGVGYGANFMALSALNKLSSDDSIEDDIISVLYDSYYKLCSILYSKSFPETYDDIVGDSLLKYYCPLNIRTNKFDGTVLSSIKSDVTILNTINRVLALMYTCNQYLVPTAMHNIYTDDK